MGYSNKYPHEIMSSKKHKKGSLVKKIASFLAVFFILMSVGYGVGIVPESWIDAIEYIASPLDGPQGLWKGDKSTGDTQTSSQNNAAVQGTRTQVSGTLNVEFIDVGQADAILIYGYYTKTEHSCRNYERNRAAAKVFKNIDDAIAELGSITFHASKVTFERAGADSAKSSKPAEKLFALRITEGDRAGAYIVKLTRNRIWTSTSSEKAKMFPSEKAVLKWAEDHHLTKRFGNAIRAIESVKLEVKSNGC